MNFLDILAVLLEAGIVDVKLKVNLPPGFLAELDKAATDHEIDGKELGALIRKYSAG